MVYLYVIWDGSSEDSSYLKWLKKLHILLAKGRFMKKLILLITLFSSSAFAHDRCYTQGDCQKSTTASDQMCVIASTGTDHFGNATCALRCVSVNLGSYCHFFKDEIYGVCRDEKRFPMPIFNPADPKRCDNAVDI